MVLPRASWEVLVAPPERATTADAIRGALVASSQAIAREHGLERAYFDALPAADRAALREVVAQAWLPIELGVVHYQAMGTLFPSVADQIQNGREASERTQNAFIKTLGRALSATGQREVPILLKRLPAAFERTLRGGSAAVYRTGPKDARIELAQYPILAIDYARNAWQGMFESALSIVASRVFVRQDPRGSDANHLAFNVAWV